MPPEPIEEQIEVAIAARLSTIQEGTVIYPDPPATVEYWTTPSVTRVLLPIDQYQAPVLSAGILGVMRASGGVMEVSPRDPAIDHFHRVAVWGYVTATATALAGTAMNRLAGDARRCLMTNRRLNGLVLDLRPDGARDTDDGDREPKAFFRQHWLARMTEDFAPQDD